MGSKFDLAIKRSNVNVGPLAILVDLLSMRICAKMSQGLFGSAEEDFQRFLPYMGMAAILVNGPLQF